VWSVCQSVTLSQWQMCTYVCGQVCVWSVCQSVTVSQWQMCVYVCGQVCVWSVCQSVTLSLCHTVTLTMTSYCCLPWLTGQWYTMTVSIDGDLTAVGIKSYSSSCLSLTRWGLFVDLFQHASVGSSGMLKIAPIPKYCYIVAKFGTLLELGSAQLSWERIFNICLGYSIYATLNFSLSIESWNGSKIF